MEKMGISGRLAAFFQHSQLTPLLALLALLAGMFAIGVTPQEEEPQIEVTFANVFVPFPGASTEDVENLLSFPLEQVLSELEGVEHVYTVSSPGLVVATIQFEVGQPRQDAIVRLYNAIYSNADWLPPGLGAGQPLIKPMGIDDVPVMAFTLSSADPAVGVRDMSAIAHQLETELKRIPGTRDIYTIGAPDRAVLVTLDPQRLATYGLNLAQVAAALKTSNVVREAGAAVAGNRETQVTAGTFLSTAQEVAGTIVGLQRGQPIHLEDIATVQDHSDQPLSYVWHHAADGNGARPAVTVAIAKQPGTNAADITRAVTERIERLRNVVIPEGIDVTITRDYGQTASEKASKLIQKLVFATGSVILLVLFALGRREAVVVGSAVVITLALTLFASWAWGFTINRVSLFALIFSIGILVDDAIVVVENIHRHMQGGGKSLADVIPRAVDEVGGPTILATYTVIAALMPMAFVSGLMGPYMSPIPINASTGMLLSLAVAFTVTPWLAYRLLARHAGGGAGHAEADARLHAFFARTMSRFLHGPQAPRQRRLLFAAMGLLVLFAVSLAAVKLVVLKMLPFDNKSEFQIVLDMPEGSTLEQTNRVLGELAGALRSLPELRHVQGYAGAASPINFNGLVRQYYLRAGSHQGDLQVNLKHQHDRDRSSHEIAASVRPALAAIGKRYGASVKVVEVPPGPPVMAPIVAEIYGPDYASQRDMALKLEQAFREVEDIVDVDTSVEAAAPRALVVVDRDKAARYGITQEDIVLTLQAGSHGLDVSYLMTGQHKYPQPVRLRLSEADRSGMEPLLALSVTSREGRTVPISELVSVVPAQRQQAIYHKDLLPYAFVTGDMAGELDSPLYGMFDLVGRIGAGGIGGTPVEQYFVQAPAGNTSVSVKWDGEWQITYETFRDMGLAYGVGMILIYLLVVAQFRSYLVPLIIMAPIPLTIIGVMPGHAIMGAQFTATSMIGMIALAGIIVRNSILLVDFIDIEMRSGTGLADAVVSAAAVRARPIALTAVAAMMGGMFILDDPIFSGLAVSLVFGLLISTLLTLVVIPLLYYSYLMRKSKHSGT